MSKNNQDTDLAGEQPPIFKTWKQVYLFVLVLHAFIITLFYLLTHSFS